MFSVYDASARHIVCVCAPRTHPSQPTIDSCCVNNTTQYGTISTTIICRHEMNTVDNIGPVGMDVRTPSENNLSRSIVFVSSGRFRSFRTAVTHNGTHGRGRCCSGDDWNVNGLSFICSTNGRYRKGADEEAILKDRTAMVCDGSVCYDYECPSQASAFCVYRCQLTGNSLQPVALRKPFRQLRHARTHET